jgi:hypothetical protein
VVLKMSTYRVVVKYWDRHYGDGHTQFRQNFEARRSAKADKEAIDILENALKTHSKPQGRIAEAWAERSDRGYPSTLRKYDGSSGSWIRVDPIRPTSQESTMQERHLGFHTEEHRVADFNTLEDLTSHARDELGATHVLHIDDEIHIYFPRQDGTFEKAEIWQKDGYWHAQGPGSRAIVQRLPTGAKPIAEAGRRAAEARPTARVRDYIAIDNRGRTIAGPFKSFGDAKDAAGGGGAVKFVPSSREAGETRIFQAKRGGTKADPRAVAFFFEHAGYGYGPGETPEQGRKRGAVALAKAEQEATARGWAVEWSEDPDGWDSLGDIDPETVKEILSAVLKDENGEVLASLGGIVDPDRAYGRVVEAELALEALSEQGASEARPRPKVKRSARRRRR